MSQLIFTRQFDQDLERLTRFLLQRHPEDAVGLIEIIIADLEVLTHSPEIGRPYRLPKRELVISRGKSGYLALYEYRPKTDLVVVLNIRHQRESGYKRNKSK
jgi:plasmid stabilization system protein ParE